MVCALSYKLGKLTVSLTLVPYNPFFKLIVFAFVNFVNVDDFDVLNFVWFSVLQELEYTQKLFDSKIIMREINAINSIWISIGKFTTKDLDNFKKLYIVSSM